MIAQFRWTDIMQVFVVTTLMSYLLTPLVRTMAFKFDYLDHPKSNKVHAHPTALLGGLSIYIAFISGIFMTMKFNQDPRISAILIGSTFLLTVGLVDDKLGMAPEHKLLAQILAAMVVIRSGVRIEFFHNYYINLFITYLWMVGITNAFNLLDNMNGLSSGVAAIAAFFFGIVMWTSNQPDVAIIAFALAGASLGFLKHNFPKAKIFMGDTGSLVIGFVLSSIAVLGSWKTRFLTTSLAMPIVILAYPIFDTTLVTVMRLLERRSIFQGGKDHSSHRLALIGFKKRGAVLAIYGLCFFLGVSALIIQRISLRSAIGSFCAVAVFLVILGVRLAMVDTGRYGRMKGEKWE